MFCFRANFQKTTVNSSTTGFGNRFRVYITSCVRSIMNYLTTCIKELTFTSECYTCKFSMCTFTIEDTHWIQARNFGTKGARYPFDCTIFTYYTTFCVKVVHVLGPVFNCRVTQCSIVFNEQFNSACMKVRYVILRSRTTFDEVQFSTFFYDDHSMFELTSTWCIQAEIRL